MKPNNRYMPIALCASALMLHALTGCSKETPAPVSTAAAHAEEDHSGHDHSDHADTDAPEKLVRSDTYADIKGIITAIPVEGMPSSELMIHHEHIPSFRKKDGEIHVNSSGVSGMRSMTMEFPPAEGISLDGLAVGDKVQFTFVVNWGGLRAWEVTKIEKIDPATEISFEDMAAADPHAGHDHGSDDDTDHDAP